LSRAEHSGSGPHFGLRGADAVQLGQGAAARPVQEHRQQRRKRRADGDQPFTSQAGEGQDEARHLGMSHGVFREGPEMKYAFMRDHRRVWQIRVQCRVLRVSVAGYHEHLARHRSIVQRRHLSAALLLLHIRAVYAENRGAYGWPRIWRQLRTQGLRAGKLRVQRLMQQHGIRARGQRPPGAPQRHRGTQHPELPVGTSTKHRPRPGRRGRSPQMRT